MRVIRADRLLRRMIVGTRAFITAAGILMAAAVTAAARPSLPAKAFFVVFAAILLAYAVGTLSFSVETRPPLTVLLDERAVAMVRAGRIVDLIGRADIGLIVVRMTTSLRGGVLVSAFEIYSPDGRHCLGRWGTQWGLRGAGRLRRELAVSGYPRATQTTWSSTRSGHSIAPGAPAWALNAVAGRAPSSPVQPEVYEEPYTVVLGTPAVSATGEVRFSRRKRWVRVTPASIEGETHICDIRLHDKVAASDVRLVAVKPELRTTRVQVTTTDDQIKVLRAPARVDRVRRALRAAGYVTINGSPYDGRFMKQPPQRSAPAPGRSYRGSPPRSTALLAHWLACHPRLARRSGRTPRISRARPDGFSARTTLSRWWMRGLTHDYVRPGTHDCRFGGGAHCSPVQPGSCTQ